MISDIIMTACVVLIVFLLMVSFTMLAMIWDEVEKLRKNIERIKNVFERKANEVDDMK